MRHLTNTYMMLAIQRTIISELQIDWISFFDEKITCHFSACVFCLTYVKNYAFKIGCLYCYLLVWQQTHSHHHFEYMHLFQVNYEVKFHLLFLIFPSAPFLKERFHYAKGRRRFFGWKVHLVLSS